MDQIQAICAKQNLPVYAMLIDLQKAFDSVLRSDLFDLLQEKKIDKATINKL